jgi:hypothetical protein
MLFVAGKISGEHVIWPRNPLCIFITFFSENTPANIFDPAFPYTRTEKKKHMNELDLKREMCT